MVQFTTITFTVMAALAGFVAADSCNNGGVYCGYSLIAKGESSS